MNTNIKIHCTLIMCVHKGSHEWSRDGCVGVRAYRPAWVSEPTGTTEAQHRPPWGQLSGFCASLSLLSKSPPLACYAHHFQSILSYLPVSEFLQHSITAVALILKKMSPVLQQQQGFSLLWLRPLTFSRPSLTTHCNPPPIAPMLSFEVLSTWRSFFVKALPCKPLVHLGAAMSKHKNICCCSSLRIKYSFKKIQTQNPLGLQQNYHLITQRLLVNMSLIY